jgi:hypothetical protein
LAIPAGFIAFGVADKAPIPDWLRFVILPGVLIAFRFVQQQDCWGFSIALGRPWAPMQAVQGSRASSTL